MADRKDMYIYARSYLALLPSPLLPPLPCRIDERIETVIEDGRLERAKVEKHRECWPTAFYERGRNGEPIFVDRMGILGMYVRDAGMRCDGQQASLTQINDLNRIGEHNTLSSSFFFLRNKHADLGRLKKSLTMKEMVSYYVQNMEARRRILFPHLSRRTGQLVTQVATD